jgi:hypothetical protein
LVGLRVETETSFFPRLAEQPRFQKIVPLCRAGFSTILNLRGMRAAHFGKDEGYPCHFGSFDSAWVLLRYLALQ